MNQPDPLFDVAIVGGGINGVGIAADAAGRGLNVVLLEQNDLGSATSSASTKLIHGGLRYLETYEFSLVRKALKESELLLRQAPHLIRPININLPYLSHLRPWLLIRAGLFLYNHLASRPSYPRARAVNFSDDSPLRQDLRRGFRFSDAQVDDARLVILNAVQAREAGADIRPGYRCCRISRQSGHWELGIQDRHGRDSILNARVVINAAGPWVSSLVTDAVGIAPQQQVRLVKGSHITVPAVYPGDDAYMLQNEDGRIVFVIPFQQRFTIIGTTEEEHQGDPGNASISEAETRYLLDVVNGYFQRKLEERDIVWSWSGIRPLIDDRESPASRVSRDYRLLFEETPLPLLSVYGGKITTYRLLAQDAVDRLAQHFPDLPASSTATSVLPGGDFRTRESLRQDLAAAWPWMPRETLERWVCSYGTRSRKIIGDSGSLADLGHQFGHGLTEREVDYLIREEWARSTEDVLWRRTKLGLLFDAAETQRLDDYLTTRQSMQHAQSA